MVNCVKGRAKVKENKDYVIFIRDTFHNIVMHPHKSSFSAVERSVGRLEF